MNFDITLEKNGFIADSSKTYLVGNAAPATRRLVQIAQQAMWQGIEAVTFRTINPSGRSLIVLDWFLNTTSVKA
ncbi:methionine aminopeptidase [Ruegeria meonggei]|uniref:Methionine aminopeptidase n=1 Tax=Ruegeria meonggei TaxID=1446476 RepID=A0A1X6ZVX7_9RHOB|nr:methionine aminopeptidase [Ruegeria meonggei]